MSCTCSVCGSLMVLSIKLLISTSYGIDLCFRLTIWGKLLRYIFDKIILPSAHSNTWEKYSMTYGLFMTCQPLLAHLD
jgi:hypothetical protein